MELKYLGHRINDSKALENTIMEARKGNVDMDNELIIKAVKADREGYKRFLGERIDDDDKLKELFVENYLGSGEYGIVEATQEFSKNYINAHGIGNTHAILAKEVEFAKMTWFKNIESDIEKAVSFNSIDTWISEHPDRVEEYANIMLHDSYKYKNKTELGKWIADNKSSLEAYAIMKEYKKPWHVSYGEVVDIIQEFVEICKCDYICETQTNGYGKGFIEFMKDDKTFSPKAVVAIRELIAYVLFKSYVWEYAISGYAWRETALKEEGQEYLSETFPEIKAHTIKKAMMK